MNEPPTLHHHNDISLKVIQEVWCIYRLRTKVHKPKSFSTRPDTYHRSTWRTSSLTHTLDCEGWSNRTTVWHKLKELEIRYSQRVRRNIKYWKWENFSWLVNIMSHRDSNPDRLQKSSNLIPINRNPYYIGTLSGYFSVYHSYIYGS